MTIKRDAVPQTGYIPLLLNQAGAGTLPNIVMIDNPYVAQFASTGVLMPLEKIGPINTSDIAPTELYDGIYKGTVYAVPPYTNTIAVFYNKTMFAAAHLSPPQTWAQLVSDSETADDAAGLRLCDIDGEPQRRAMDVGTLLVEQRRH